MPGGEPQAPSKVKTFTEIFWEVLPYYLSIGMTWDQFWNGDVRMAVAYRKAEAIRIEKQNADFWLQGMYVYEAICDASPIFNPFAKKNTRPRPYPSQPYESKREQAKKKQEAEKKVFDKAQKMMDAFATKINTKFRKQQEVTAHE